MPEHQLSQHRPIISGNWGDMAIMGLVIALILWILRRQSTIADNFENSITSIKTEIVTYKESWDTRKDGLFEAINRVCHERQSACSGIVDQKLRGVDSQVATICRKIDEVKQDRSKKWEKQEKINEDVLRLKEGFGKHEGTL